MEFKAGQALGRGRMRLMMYGGVLLGIFISTALSGAKGAWLTRFTVLLIPLILLMLLVDLLVIRKLPRKGEVVVTLEPDALVSRLLSSRLKRVAWQDMESARVESLGGHMVLQLRLRPTPQRPDRRAFFTGNNPARPYLTLTALSPADQERLLDAVQERLRERQAGMAATPAPNELAMARALEERLVSLAPRPWASMALIAANVVVWLVTAWLGAGWLTGNADRLYALGGNTASAVQGGQWWRLLSAAFLHSGAPHLFFNMVGLWVAGVLVERIFGRAAFLLVYLGSALAGSTASLYFSAQTTVSVGASGAVFGLAGALVVAVAREREALPRLFNRRILGGMSLFIGYSLLMGLTRPGIDNAAHVGGLLAGALLALLLPTRFDLQQYEARLGNRMALALVLLVAVLPWAASRAPAAAVDVQARIESRKVFERAAREFDEVVKAVRQDAEDQREGRRSALEVEERSRSVHAPRMHAVAQALESVQAHVGGSGLQAYVADLLILARSLHELLAMASVMVDGKLVPADQARARVLQETIQAANARLLRLQGNNKQPS
ncbi:rhomboid family intramembrane serine protease [Hydrogenophaga sp.]|uniref:rhomboid family intramembrane serine protease n=1 Tax=Hydrogenophaga sp. TaxID=1904254 RepID=UPI00260C14FA|nr:rhomboid family intramembrane serine protease [Hydrogenophaga sp.]MCW5654865.1 rhomboid family intramembrane serine protease [Hydrogenophaga sp.]